MLVKAHYSYNKERGQFEEGKGAIRCFDLNGNIAPFEFDIRPVNGKKKIQNKTPAQENIFNCALNSFFNRDDSKKKSLSGKVCKWIYIMSADWNPFVK